MVDAGEISGQLDRVFIRMADHFEKEFKLNHKVKSAMTYPIIVCAIAAIVIFVLMWKVVPTFAGVLTSMGSKLPGFTNILISISMFFQNFWWLIILLVIGAVVGIKTYAKSYSGKRFFGNLSIKLPILKGVTKTIMTARLTRTLGTLISSGVLLIQALEIVQKVLGNVIIVEKMDEVIEEIKKGKGLTQPLASMKYFPPMLISMVRIGEESGNIDFALDKSADFYDQEVDTALQQLTALLEPLIMIVMGFVVGFIILSILYPMISVYQNMAN
jgi:type IV pilus assembly protein PilC